MIFETRQRRFLAEINVIPLVDVVLVLLVIFMVTAPMLYRGMDIKLPTSASNTIKPEIRAVLTMLEDSETRQTVERVRNVVVGGRTQPLEKTVRTTRVPEGHIQRVQAIVILGFDASADELKRAGQLARQALRLLPARGDSLSVYALPVIARAAPQAESANRSLLRPFRSRRCSRERGLPRSLNSPNFRRGGWLLARAGCCWAGSAGGVRVGCRLPNCRQRISIPNSTPPAIRCWRIRAWRRMSSSCGCAHEPGRNRTSRHRSMRSSFQKQDVVTRACPSQIQGRSVSFKVLGADHPDSQCLTHRPHESVN